MCIINIIVCQLQYLFSNINNQFAHFHNGYEQSFYFFIIHSSTLKDLPYLLWIIVMQIIVHTIVTESIVNQPFEVTARIRPALKAGKTSIT